jgi:hypothetical protein
LKTLKDMVGRKKWQSDVGRNDNRMKNVSKEIERDQYQV